MGSSKRAGHRKTAKMGACVSCCSDPAVAKKSKKKSEPLKKQIVRPKKEKNLVKPVVMCGNLEKQAVKESTFEELCDILDEEVDEKNMSEREIVKTKRRLSKLADKRNSQIALKRNSQISVNVENIL